MGDNKGNNRPHRIRIGRLSVDPIFLVIFLFFMTSSLTMFIFILFSMR